MADEHESLVAEMIGEGTEILDHVRDPVLRQVGRLPGEVVAAHVGRDGLVIAAEFDQLPPPLVPELGNPWTNTMSGPRPAVT